MGLLRLANSSQPTEAVGAVLGTLLSMRHMGSRRLNPSLLSSHQLPNSGGSPGMGPFSGSPSWESSTSPPPLCLAGGPRAPLPSRPLLDICLVRSQVGAWAACCCAAPALRGAGGDVMNPWDLLLPLSYQQCCSSCAGFLL